VAIAMLSYKGVLAYTSCVEYYKDKIEGEKPEEEHYKR
jgi:hypothetical protein